MDGANVAMIFCKARGKAVTVKLPSGVSVTIGEKDASFFLSAEDAKFMIKNKHGEDITPRLLATPQ